MKKLYVCILSIGVFALSGVSAKNKKPEFDEYLTHITCFVHFVKNLYPSYLEFKEKTPYGLDRAKKWASGRVFGWFEGNDPSKIWVSERFGEMGYRMATGLPFDHEGPCPFEIAILHKEFRTNIYMISEWKLGNKKFEYWTIVTDSNLGRDAVFILLGSDSIFETRQVLFLDTIYRNRFVLDEGVEIRVNENNRALFHRMSVYEFSKSFKGSIWEKKAPLREYDKKTKEFEDEYKLKKIPRKWKRYKDLFTKERKKILMDYLRKQDLLPSEDNAVIATIENSN